MGAAYARVDPGEVDRVLLLGPSHHLYTRRCALSASRAWGTPLGDLEVDVAEMEALLERGNGKGKGGGEESRRQLFDVLARDDDEAEHSLELHTSFIRRVLERGGNSSSGGGRRGGIPPLVPVMVGALSPEDEAATAAALLPLARDERTLVVVSSDFCHWGSRFSFQSLGEEEEGDEDDEDEDEEEGEGDDGEAKEKKGNKSKKSKKKKKGDDGGGDGTIADAIERLDRRGMRLIERQDGPGFRRYLSRTRNTICGRYPISLFLEVLRQLREGEGGGSGSGSGGAGGGGSGGTTTTTTTSKLTHSVKFVAYDQSQRVTRPSESSVSYAAALVRVV